MPNELLLDRVETFLAFYQAATEGAGGSCKPLNYFELQCLPGMILAGNLYVLHWIIEECYRSRPDPEEYLPYMRHWVRQIKWFESNMTELEMSVMSQRL